MNIKEWLEMDIESYPTLTPEDIDTCAKSIGVDFNYSNQLDRIEYLFEDDRSGVRKDTAYLELHMKVSTILAAYINMFGENK